MPSVRTTDIDFYVPDSKRANAAGLSERLKSINYEFLAKLNREGLSCVRLGSSGVFAESLSYVELFGSNYIEVKRNGILVKVASPSAFAIQKILINDRRGNKAEKDS